MPKAVGFFNPHKFVTRYINKKHKSLRQYVTSSVNLAVAKMIPLIYKCAGICLEYGMWNHSNLWWPISCISNLLHLFKGTSFHEINLDKVATFVKD